MLEVTVKTLDSQNHAFSVPDESTVKEFKDQIAPVLNIAADKQRLIFCGKVLKDDKKLSDYDVNGKVIHVVQSLPPQGNSSTSTSSNSTSSTTGGSRNHRDAAGFLLGAFTIPQEMVDPSQVQNIVQDVVTGMGDIGRNATVMSRASDDGSVDVHINLGRVPVQVPLQSEAQLRMNRVQTMLIRANHLLESLEDGANSNNGNVADSSSQTETENNEQSSPMEGESGNSLTTDEVVSNNLEMSSSSEESTLSGEAHINAEITSEINLGNTGSSPNEPERFRFEGLAHAAQAAISAAFATAAAAARAATASVSNPVQSNSGTTAPTDSEPMDATPTGLPTEFMNPPPPILPEDPTIITMDSLPSDSEPVATEQTQTENEPNAESDNHHPDCPLSISRTPSNTSAPSSRRPVLVQPSVQTLANLLDEVIRVNTRLQPCLERCRDLIRSDSTLTGRALGDAHRLFSRVSQLMHFLSHAYHSLSDLHINFTQPPPRSPRVRIISSTHSSSLFPGIPMQAQISISTTNGALPNQGQSTTTTANNANGDTTRNSTTETRPVPAPRVSQAPTATPVSTSSNGTSSNFSLFSRAQNPVVFMEVSPGSVTIDSISQLSLPIGNPGVPVPSDTTDANSPTPLPRSNSNIPVQGILRTGANTIPITTRVETPTSTPSPSEGNTDTQSNTTRSTAPNATPLLNGQGPQPINIPFRNLIPVPLTSMGSLHTFDSGLPCHSVWALEPSRRRHNAGGSRTTSSTAYQAGMNPNAPGRQEDQLQQVISNIMMSLLNHTPTPNNPIPAGFTMFPNRNDDVTRDGLFFLNAMGGRERSPRAEGTPTGSTSANPQSSSSSSVGHQETVNLFTNLGMINMRISEVIPSSCFNENELIGQLLISLSKEFNIKDMLDLSFGQYETYTKIRGPLQRYLYNEIFLTENPTDAEIETVAMQLANEIELQFEAFIMTVEVRAGRNYKAAVSSFLRQNMRKLIDAVLSKDISTITYGVHLMRTCQNIIREFLTLTDQFTHNGSDVLEEMIRSRIEPMTVDIDLAWQGGIRSWLLASVAKGFIIFSPKPFSCTSSSPNGRKPPGISRIFSPRNPSSDASKKPASAKSGSSETSRPNRPNHGMRRANFVEALGVNEALAGGLSGSRAAPTLAAFARIAEQTTALLRNNARTNDNRPPVHGIAEVVLNDSWHNSVPREWVPIITRDVQRQRRQAPQAPFSNAYLTGMPSKRRKIMTNGSPTLLEPSQSALSDMLLQAISSADVKPATNIEEVKKDASQDAPLQNSFNEHMKHAIQERLQRDLDYCSERFPNSERYFN